MIVVFSLKIVLELTTCRKTETLETEVRRFLDVETFTHIAHKVKCNISFFLTIIAFL